MQFFFYGLAASIAGLFLFTQFMARRIERRFPPSGEMLRVKGGVLHVVRNSPPTPRGSVVLLHGASGNQADMMVALGDRLAALGFDVIGVDRPGSGFSARTGAASPAEQAKRIRAGLAQIGVEKAIVVGHSLAGAVAVNFALDQADFTQGLVLISPVTHPWPGGIAWFYHAAAAPVLGVLFTRLLTLPLGLLSLNPAIRHVFAPRNVPAVFATQTGAALALRAHAFRANAQDVAGVYDFVSLQCLREGEIAAPTAIISGDSDRVVFTSIHSYASAKAIKGATLTILANMGHSPHHCDPDAVVRAIEGVAARVASQPVSHSLESTISSR